MRVYRNTPIGNLNTNVWTPVAINDYSEDIAYDGSGNITKYKRYGDNNVLMDSLSYKYYANTNKLSSIRDNVSATAFTNDIDNQTSNTNYDYDAIGNLTKDSAASIGANGIEWTVYGKISKDHQDQWYGHYLHLRCNGQPAEQKSDWMLRAAMEKPGMCGMHLAM